MSIDESIEKPCCSCLKKGKSCRPTYWDDKYWCIHYVFLENQEEKKLLEFLSFAKNNFSVVPQLDQIYLEWKKSLKKN